MALLPRTGSVVLTFDGSTMMCRLPGQFAEEAIPCCRERGAEVQRGDGRGDGHLRCATLQSVPLVAMV